MNTEAMTVALSANWLNTSESVAVMSNASVTNGAGMVSGTLSGGEAWTTTTYCPGWWVYPNDYYRPYYVPVPVVATPAEKIRLTSGDVERLRRAAGRDAKLKAILNKFTPLIEVTLEF